MSQILYKSVIIGFLSEESEVICLSMIYKVPQQILPITHEHIDPLKQ